MSRTISVLLSAALLIGSVIAYGSHIRPLYAEVSLLRGTMVAKQRLFAEKQHAVAKVESLIKQYQGAGSLEEAVSLSLPHTEEVASVFNQIQAVAAAHGIAVQVFNVQPLAERPDDGADSGQSLVRPLGTLRISLRVAGPYESFKAFLRDLETNVRIMDAVSVKVEPGAYTVVADAYYQSE
jgi:Tfp pilus assembly protein PilO